MSAAASSKVYKNHNSSNNYNNNHDDQQQPSTNHNINSAAISAIGADRGGPILNPTENTFSPRRRPCLCRDMKTPGPSRAVFDESTQENTELPEHKSLNIEETFKIDSESSEQPLSPSNDMRTPGSSKAVFDENLQRSSQDDKEFQPLFPGAIACICRDMRTPGPSRVFFDGDPQQISHNQPLSSEAIACTTRDMRTPGPSRVFFDGDPQQISQNQPLSSEAIACTNRDMRTPGPSRVFFDGDPQQISQNQPFFSEAIACTTRDMRTPGPSRVFFDGDPQQISQNQPLHSGVTSFDMRTPGPSKAVFDNSKNSQESEFYSALSNTEDERNIDLNLNNRRIVKKTAKQRNRQKVAMELFNELLKVMNDDNDDDEEIYEAVAPLQHINGNLITSEAEITGEDGIKYTITTEHTSNHTRQNNLSETSDRWITTRTILQSYASKDDNGQVLKDGGERSGIIWEPGREKIDFENYQIPENPIPNVSEDESLQLILKLDNENNQVLRATDAADDSENIQKGQKQNAPELRNFINSLLCDLDSIRKTKNKFLCRIDKPCSSDSQMKIHPVQPIEKKKCPKSYTGTPPESFPVTIISVVKLGRAALYVKWIIHDCNNIGGYEIYVDNYPKNKYYNSNHTAGVVCNVDVTQCQKIALIAVPRIEEAADGSHCNYICKKWIPSIYLFDPHITS